jgi:hypothetical protein
MRPITIKLPPKATSLTPFDELPIDPRVQDCEYPFEQTVGMYLDFTHWVSVTHVTKNKVKSKIPKSDLNQLGCDNPDIWVISKTDDTIVITPSKTALENKKYRKTSHVTELSAGEILGEYWLPKINPLKFNERWDSLLRMVTPDQDLWESINVCFDRRELMGVIYIPKPRALTLMFRGRNRPHFAK